MYVTMFSAWESGNGNELLIFLIFWFGSDIFLITGIICYYRYIENVRRYNFSFSKSTPHVFAVIGRLFCFK